MIGKLNFTLKSGLNGKINIFTGTLQIRLVTFSNIFEIPRWLKNELRQGLAWQF